MMQREHQWSKFVVGDKFVEGPASLTIPDEQGLTLTNVSVTEPSTLPKGKLCQLEKIIEIKKFSSLQKLLRVTAYVFKFIEKIRKKKEDKKEEKLYTEKSRKNKQIKN